MWYTISMMKENIQRECAKHGVVRHHLRTRGNGATKSGYYCVKCKAEAVHEHRKRKKLWCLEYKGGRCERCGYDKCPAALEFHHRDPGEKEFAFGKYQAKSYEALAKELDKCDLLCSNCHKEVHYG